MAQHEENDDETEWKRREQEIGEEHPPQHELTSDGVEASVADRKELLEEKVAGEKTGQRQERKRDPQPSTDDDWIARPQHPLMGSNEEGQQGRALGCLDTARFAQETIHLTLGERRAEDIVRPGVPS